MLFEGIVTDFLSKEGYSTEDFYEEVRQTKVAYSGAEGEGEEEGGEEADAVVNVMNLVADFSSWAAEMSKQAKYRKEKAAAGDA